MSKVFSNIFAISLLLFGNQKVPQEVSTFVCHLPKEPTLTFSNRAKMRKWYLHQANEMFNLPLIQSFILKLTSGAQSDNLFLTASKESYISLNGETYDTSYRITSLQPFGNTFIALNSYTDNSFTVFNGDTPTGYFAEFTQGEQEAIETFIGLLNNAGNEGLAPQKSVYIFKLGECLERVDENLILGNTAQ